MPHHLVGIAHALKVLTTKEHKSWSFCVPDDLAADMANWGRPDNDELLQVGAYLLRRINDDTQDEP